MAAPQSGRCNPLRQSVLNGSYAWPSITLLCIAVPFVLGTGYYLHTLQVILLFSIVAMAVNLVSGYAGQLSFGHGGLLAIGAYTFAIVTTRYHATFLAGVLLAIVVTTLAGLLLGLPSIRLGSFYLALVTLGFGMVVPQWVSEWEPVTGGWQGISGLAKPDLPFVPTSHRDLAFYYVILAVTGLVFYVVNNLLRSPWGRSFIAFRESEVAAQSVGIWISYRKVVVFLVSAGLTGAAGALYASLIGYISPPSFELELSLFFFLAMVFGGMGTYWGPVVGVAALYLLSDVFLSGLQLYRLFAYGIFTVLVAILLPTGVVGALLGLRKSRQPSGRQLMPSQGDPPPVSSLPGTLRISHLTRRFGGVVAVDRFSTDIRPGRLHAIIGPNGSGKTTLLNLISRFYQLDSGAIGLGSVRLDLLPPHEIPRHGIARTFQTPRVIPGLSAMENIMLGLDCHDSAGFWSYLLHLPAARRAERARIERALRVLAFIGMGHVTDEPAEILPHGQQRFLEIGRAMALRPGAILLDEPAAGLTQPEIEHLITMLRSLQASGCTLVMIEHNVDLVMQVSDTITVLEGGRRLAEDEPAIVRANPEVVRAYFGARG